MLCAAYVIMHNNAPLHPPPFLADVAAVFFYIYIYHSESHRRLESTVVTVCRDGKKKVTGAAAGLMGRCSRELGVKEFNCYLTSVLYSVTGGKKNPAPAILAP